MALRKHPHSTAFKKHPSSGPRQALIVLASLALIGQAGWSFAACSAIETAIDMRVSIAGDNCTASLTTYSPLTATGGVVLLAQGTGTVLTHLAPFSASISGGAQLHAYGVLAQYGGAAYLQGATLTQTVGSGGSILNNRSNSAIRAFENGSVTVEGNLSISTAGLGARGIYASGAGTSTSVTLNNSGLGSTQITTSGMAAPAIQVGKTPASGTGGATLRAKARVEAQTTSTPSALGSSPALYIAEDGSSFTADYANSSGSLASKTRTLLLSKGSNMLLSLRNYDITTSGSGTDTAPIYVGGGTTNSTLTLLGQSSVTAPTNGYLVLSEGRVVDDSASYNPTATLSSSSLTLNAEGKTVLTGSISTATGSTLDLNLDDSTWKLVGYGGALNTPSTLTTLKLTNGSILDVGSTAGTTAYTIQADVTNTASTLLLKDGIVSDVLTIDGDLTLTGGIVSIDTQLGGDSSPTDLLAITGDSSGTATLNVTNVSGLGAATSTGIKVIEVQGSSNATFTLASPLIIGSWQYTLVKSGNDWYLRAGPYTAPSATPIPVNTPWVLTLLGLFVATAGMIRVGKKNSRR